MYRTLALAAAIAALSVPAFAGDITISLAGKTKAQVMNEIHLAATSVCIKSGYTQLGMQLACTAQVEQDTLLSLDAAFKAKG